MRSIIILLCLSPPKGVKMLICSLEMCHNSPVIGDSFSFNKSGASHSGRGSGWTGKEEGWAELLPPAGHLSHKGSSYFRTLCDSPHCVFQSCHATCSLEHSVTEEITVDTVKLSWRLALHLLPGANTPLVVTCYFSPAPSSHCPSTWCREL
jgi:hypothetical protein